MTLPLFVLPAAKQDWLEAQEWYESQRTGLGAEFSNELAQTFERIEAYPRSYPRIHRSLRRALMGRFPYGVFYRIEAQRSGVIAIFHTSRSPRIWKRRA